VKFAEISAEAIVVISIAKVACGVHLKNRQ
jgi:hypothetical protein